MKKGNNKYLFYIISNKKLINEIRNLHPNTVQPNINKIDLDNSIIPYTQSLEEQTQIADYLDLICDKLNRKITNIQKQIKLLKEYKQSLIYEVVTGKKQI